MRFAVLASASLSLALVLICAPSLRADDRIPWTTLKIQGSPEPPPPYAIEPAFPALTFNRPVVVVSAPGSDRLFVGEQDGKIVSFPDDPKSSKTDLAIDLKALHPDLSNLYGLVFHPKFGQNHEVYVAYTKENNKPDGTVVSKFLADPASPTTFDPKSEQVILTFLSGGHNGACLAFGNDGHLYISTGDGSGPTPPDGLDTGQDVSDLLSSILRVDVDHPDAGRGYSIPKDNPFVDTRGARPEIWAYGFRNPWKMSVDRATGDLWVGDVGWELWELVDRVERGGNYGWSAVEGLQPVHPEGRRGPTPILPPTVAHPHSEAASITGGYVYRGKRLPELEGVYVYGDFQSGKVWGLRHDGKRVTWHQPLADTPLELVAFGEDRAGELYLMDYERTRQLHRLIPNPGAKANRDFPKTLSATGLFASTAKLEPSPGVIPYGINVPLWADHATAERHLAIPGEGRIKLGDKGQWLMPEGSVVARTVSMEMVAGVESSRRRLETQILHIEDDIWRPYTYVWNDAQNEATLAPISGSSKLLAIRDDAAPGGSRTVNYRFAARAECTLCHNPWVEKKTANYGRQSASPLALITPQMNTEVTRGGKRVNQVREFARLGLLDSSWPEGVDRAAHFPNPHDGAADVNARARAYLHVHCAHCHQFNAGGVATILLGSDVPLGETQTIGARPSQGAFDIDDARIIQPGDPDSSVLLYRMSKMGGGHMPRLGASEVDVNATRLIAEWIERMPPASNGGVDSKASEIRSALASLKAPKIGAAQRKAAIESLTSTTRGALALLRAVDAGEIPAPTRAEAVALSGRHPKGEVSDLFERFLPESERVARLGETIDPKTILEMPGDSRRGRDIFMTHPGAQCKSCHQLDKIGEPLGPDLAKVGSKYPRPELLGQILEPSKQIDPKFATVVVATKDGRVLSGLLAEQTDEAVVVKDARGQATRVPTSEVETIAPQARSLMPEQLLRDLTAQQAADLLEYLSTLK